MASFTTPRGLGVAVLLATAGCSSFEPAPLDDASFLARALVQEDEHARVSVAVLDGRESRRYCGVDLASDGVQPVWISVENRADHEWWFLWTRLDPDYFTPLEAAYVNHSMWSPETNRAIDAHFASLGIPRHLDPGGKVSGFVFTTRDDGAKLVRVTLLGGQELADYHFLAEPTGVRADYESVDFRAMARDRGIVRHRGFDERLRRRLETLPRTTCSASGDEEGDPVNIVVIGDPTEVHMALSGRGWDVTEEMYWGSIWKTVHSFFTGTYYRYSPVSPLYLFGRKQDVALQKTRTNIHERNHMRLWLTPYRVDERPVWVGQISRDIGVRFTTRTWNLMTHKIDPDVDEARDYLAEDLLHTGRVSHLAYVRGAGAASRDHPRHNLTGDPYYTDGLRMVVMVQGEELDLKDGKFVGWERPPPR